MSRSFRDRLSRQARFESFEERIVLSAQPVADAFVPDTAQPNYGDFAPTLSDANQSSGVDYAHDSFGFTGEGQTIAVIDTGVAYDHTSLGGGFAAGYRVVAGWDFAENDANPYDDGPSGYHGTHVAGIVGSDHAVHTFTPVSHPKPTSQRCAFSTTQETVSSTGSKTPFSGSIKTETNTTLRPSTCRSEPSGTPTRFPTGQRSKMNFNN